MCVTVGDCQYIAAAMLFIAINVSLFRTKLSNLSTYIQANFEQKKQFLLEKSPKLKSYGNKN